MIPPGGEGEIQVTLRPKGGHTDITKNVVVFSNDPEQPRFTLTMKGTLLVDMVAQPSSLAIVNLAPHESGTATFSVEQSPGSTATVKSVRVADEKRFSVHEIQTAPGALATYEVKFEGGDVGMTATKVILETTGDNTPRITIPVNASASYNLRYPKRLALSQRGNGPFQETLRISTRRGDPPKIGKVEDPDGLLDIDIREAKGPTVSIGLRVKDPAAATLDTTAVHELRVETDDPDEPELVLEYTVRARSGRARADIQ